MIWSSAACIALVLLPSRSPGHPRLAWELGCQRFCLQHIHGGLTIYQALAIEGPKGLILPFAPEAHSHVHSGPLTD